MKKNENMNNKGFSLVELIVVIAIMAVLVGVAAPQFIKYVEKSRESTDITNLDSALTYIQGYYADREMSSDVTVTITLSKNATTPLKIEEGGTDKSADVLAASGLEKTKLTAANWDALVAKYERASGAVTYEIYTGTPLAKVTDFTANTYKAYYKVDGNKIVVK